MTSNFGKTISSALRQRTPSYALVAALALILLVHAPVVPVLAGCALAAAGSLLRAGMRRQEQRQ